MKKRTKKLSLTRETLHDLADLRQIAGGHDTSSLCRRPTLCECETDACGGTGSFCNTVYNC
jgi:hypothetical protein